jgi:cell division septation protein DedD
VSLEAPRERRGEGGGRSPRTRRRGPGLGSALAGAGLLVVLGFALGVVGGLVLEEPDLLLDYVLGRTEPVPVGEVARDVAARPPAVEPAPGPGAGTPPAPAAEATPAPGPGEWIAGSREEEAFAAAAPTSPPPTAEGAAVAPAPAGGFAVQVGAFADATAAEQLARRLRARGHPVYVAPAAGSDTARWRVRVGPLASRAEAEGVAARLEREERVSTWVLAESPL